LKLTCVATSLGTEAAARQLGLDVQPFDRTAHLDLAIDGADQVDPNRWLVKGGGGAHTREKIVAAAADRFVVIVSSDKLVDAVTPPIPVEILAFGAAATLEALGRWGPVAVRPSTPISPDGGIIADWSGPVGDPEGASARLDSLPGVVGHGLFPPSLVSEVIVGQAAS
jgi:ribose 5-phosphate isomerase A